MVTGSPKSIRTVQLERLVVPVFVTLTSAWKKSLVTLGNVTAQLIAANAWAFSNRPVISALTLSKNFIYIPSMYRV
jgi:hypothetical protein